MTASQDAAALYDAVLFEPLMRDFYGGDWYNVGLWTGAPTPAEACVALVRQLARAGPQAPRNVLDVGCGLGGSSATWAQIWPEAEVIGVGVSSRQLEAARRSYPHVTFVGADALNMPFAPGTFDVIAAVESALHFDTRADFLAAARRHLKPGGSLLLADLLVPSAAWPGAWSVPKGNLGWTANDYEAALGRCGFVEVQVEDVTAHTWSVYLERFSRHVDALPEEPGRNWRDSARALREAAAPIYVLASARAPSEA